ncbi:MAG: 16S rRNA (guanine(527)-N(7))-methyltransferase RsmG [Clostridiales bacterium]|nr:16S rRNA (guanine(527)-N(7))-methyltransferase RsmG [Clostridiales bacterium]
MDLGQTKDVEEVLTENKDEICVPLTAETILSFRRYAEMLKEKNKVMNLTAITDDEGIAMKHFIDSLTIASFIDSEQEKIKGRSLSLIDVGTGAGFPGIPLKINKRDLDLTLLDSLAKRLSFLEEVASELSLDNIKFVHSRAEDAGRDARYREKYDVATARAVANLPVLCEYCLPFVRKGGCFIAMKGKLDEELKNADRAISLLGGKIETIKEFQLPGTDADRTIVVIRKVKETPKRYPRQAGKPSKDPIA